MTFSPWRLRQRSFLFWLLTIQCIFGVPGLCLAAWAVHTLGQRNQELVLAELQNRVDAASDALSLESIRLRSRMRRLAADETFRKARREDIATVVTRTLQDLPAVTRMAAIGPAGDVWFSFGPGGKDIPLLMDHGVYPSVRDGDRISIEPLERRESGPSDEIHFVLHGALEQRSTRFALLLSVRRAALGDILRAQSWPDTWTAAVLDQELTIIARSRDEDKFVGQIVSPSVQELLREDVKGLRFARTKDGVEVATVIQRVDGTPWRVVAGVPRTAVDEAANGPLRRVLAGSIAFILLGIATAVWLSRRLKREMDLAARGAGIAQGIVKEFGSIRAKHLMLQNDLVGMVQLVNRRSVWHNPALEKIFGYGPGELEGHSPRQMHEDDAAFEDFGRRAYTRLSQGESFREQIRMVRKDGGRVWIDASGVALPDGSSLWMMLDVTAQKSEQDRMAGLALRDALTGLPNRAAWEESLAREVARAAQHGRPLAVGMLDLNGFKAINDTWGHAAGDALLQAVAQRLQGCLRPHDMVARLGGDEFVFLLGQFAGLDEVTSTVERLEQIVRQPITIGNRLCSVGTAIGVALYPDDAASGIDLMRVADERMYRNKRESLSKPMDR